MASLYLYRLTALFTKTRAEPCRGLIGIIPDEWSNAISHESVSHNCGTNTGKTGERKNDRSFQKVREKSGNLGSFRGKIVSESKKKLDGKYKIGVPEFMFFKN